MDRWEFEKLLSNETKENLLDALKKDIKADKELPEQEKTIEAIAGFFNVDLDNCYTELILFLLDDEVKE